jgi:Gpi18-like mannosyltransferase
MEDCIAYIEYRCLTVQAFSMTRTGPGKFTASFTLLSMSQATYPVLRRAVPRMKPALQNNNWGNALPFVFPSKKTARSETILWNGDAVHFPP